MEETEGVHVQLAVLTENRTSVAGTSGGELGTSSMLGAVSFDSRQQTADSRAASSKGEGEDERTHHTHTLTLSHIIG
jgi:hypothetical protein